MDKITLERINLVHPDLRSEVLEIYEEISSRLTGNVRCRFSHTLRTIAEQDALFAIGRTKPGKKVTNARGGQSFHNYGLAIDIVLLIDRDQNGTYETASWDSKLDSDGDKTSDWAECVSVFKMHGWEWGGDWKSFKDLPHFQKTFGFTTPQLMKMKKIEGSSYPILPKQK
jgi:peptidoglycan L-alanyl-D-glutamate endopeptidase CwlK